MLPKDAKISELKKQQVVDQINDFTAILSKFKQNVDEYEIPTDAQKRLNKFIAEIEPRLKNTTSLVTALQEENKAFLAEQLFALTTIIRDFDKRIRENIFPLEKKGDKRTNDVGFLGGHGSENTLLDILVKARDALDAMRVKRQRGVDISKLTTEVKTAATEIHEGETKEVKARAPSIADDETRTALRKRLTDFNSGVVRQFYKELDESKYSHDKKANLMAFAAQIINLNLPSYDILNRKLDVTVGAFETTLQRNIVGFETRIKSEITALERNEDRSDGENALLTILRNAKTAIDKIAKPVTAPIIFPEIPKTEVKAAQHKQTDESDNLLIELKLLISRLDALSSDLGKYNGTNIKMKEDLNSKALKWLSECKKTNETFVTSKKGYDRDKGNHFAAMDYQDQLAKLKEVVTTTKAAFDNQLSKSKATKIGMIGRKSLAVVDPALHGIIEDAEVTSDRSVRAAREIAGPQKRR